MRTPEFLWAQRADEIYLTIDVPNVAKDATVKLTDDGKVYFKGVGGPQDDTHEYVLDIELLKPIKAETSKCNIGARSVQFRIQKAESGPYWERLLKAGKNVHLKVDWNHWVDEDEEDNGQFGSGWDAKDMADLEFQEGEEDA